MLWDVIRSMFCTLASVAHLDLSRPVAIDNQSSVDRITFIMFFFDRFRLLTCHSVDRLHDKSQIWTTSHRNERDESPRKCKPSDSQLASPWAVRIETRPPKLEGIFNQAIFVQQNQPTRRKSQPINCDANRGRLPIFKLLVSRESRCIFVASHRIACFGGERVKILRFVFFFSGVKLWF